MIVVLSKGTIIKDRQGFIYQVNNIVRTKEVNSLLDASREVRSYIASNDLGASQFNGGDVYKDNKKIARVSYNGKVWDRFDNLIFSN